MAHCILTGLIRPSQGHRSPFTPRCWVPSPWTAGRECVLRLRESRGLHPSSRVSQLVAHHKGNALKYFISRAWRRYAVIGWQLPTRVGRIWIQSNSAGWLRSFSRVQLCPIWGSSSRTFFFFFFCLRFFFLSLCFVCIFYFFWRDLDAVQLAGETGPPQRQRMSKCHILSWIHTTLIAAPPSPSLAPSSTLKHGQGVHPRVTFRVSRIALMLHHIGLCPAGPDSVPVIRGPRASAPTSADTPTQMPHTSSLSMSLTAGSSSGP